MPRKEAVCISCVPACFSPTAAPIESGQKLEYTKIIFRNGEHHLVTPNKKQVPAAFFDY